MDFLRGLQEQLGVGSGGASTSSGATATAGGPGAFGGGSVPAVGRGGAPNGNNNAKPGSLLADFQQYQQGGGDVEAGNGVGGAAQAAITDLAGTVGAFFSAQYTRVAAAAAAAPSAFEEASGMPSTTQLTYFAAFLGAGLIFLALATFVFLPMIILAPAKFALTFTLGCVSVLASLASLKGWRSQLRAAAQRERLPFTGFYAASVVATLYAALVAKSYLLSLACSGLQAVALCYYVAAYFPGGPEALKGWLSWAANAAGSCVRGLFG